MSQLDLRDQARPFRPKLPAYPPELHRSAVGTWRGRMVNEYRSATVFEGLAVQLEAAGLDAETVETCRSFAWEERRHGALCGAVVEALGAEAVSEMAPSPPFPQHADTSPLEAAVRNLLSISCLSETIAVSLIGAERLEMPEGELKELLTTIYADEVGHANFGWRLLPRLLAAGDAELGQHLGTYLSVAFAHLETHELAHLPLDSRPPEEGAAIGLCSGPDARVLFYDTVEQVIVPALEALGLAARAAWAERPSSCREAAPV